jgi:hypothetical protein
VPQVHTADAPTLAYVFCWQEGTALTPYGDRPQLRSIGLGAAPQEQRLTLPLAHNAADLVVLGDTGTRVLLLAQYGYQEFEFLLCEMSDQPRLIARWPVAGQALAWLDYPGPAPVYTGLQQAGAQLSLIVHDEQAAAEYERWSFNLSSGELTRTSYTGVLPRAADSSNAVDDSAAGPPYPQTLLPTAGEAPWNIPAVCDMQGRVLVIYSSGSFEWIKPGAAAATAADRTAAKACAANACITPPPQ